MNDTADKKTRRILDTAFSSRTPLQLKEMPVKMTKQKAVMEVIADTFTKDRQYTEQELNEQLERIHPDYATLRRMLIDFHFFDRSEDGHAYWRLPRAH